VNAQKIIIKSLDNVAPLVWFFLARLQKTCTVWAIAILAMLGFLSMVVTAGKCQGDL
jgi:hypothetical protein